MKIYFLFLNKHQGSNDKKKLSADKDSTWLIAVGKLLWKMRIYSIHKLFQICVTEPPSLHGELLCGLIFSDVRPG